MHNLHFVVISSESKEDAYSSVESILNDWGTENNWYEIGGSIDEDGIVHNTGVGRYSPKSYNLFSLKDINEFVLNNINESFDLKVYGDKKIINLDEKLSSSEWYKIHCLVENMYHRQRFIEMNGGDEYAFDILESEYKNYSFDEFGVTQFDGFGVTQINKSNGHKKFVVFIDMHS